MTEPMWRRYERLTGPDLDADIRDEIEFHIQLLADKHVACGCSPEDARRRAIAEFGDMARAREMCMEIGTNQQRASRRAAFIGNIGQDLQHAARRLMKSPMFTALTVLTLAIGLGPNIAIFNIISSVLLTPLPYRDPDQLVVVNETFPMAGGSGTGSVSLPNAADWRAQNRSFSAMAVTSFVGSYNLGDEEQPERLSAAAIDAETFPMLGVVPLRGRVFRADEATSGGPNVVILSETFWRRKYAGDESVIGRHIKLDGADYEVIGIMPSRIIFPNRSAPLDVWTPLQANFKTANRGSHGFRVFARLKPGVTKELALADLRLLATYIAKQYPDAQEGRSVTITPLSETVLSSANKQLPVLLGAAALVLLIACANAASLLLARAASRKREVAILAALGATRGRVMQQFFVESLLISVLSAALGFLLAIAAVRGILLSAGTMVPRTTEITFDWRVAAFVGAAIILTTIVCGIVPALRATRANLQSNLRESTGGERAGSRFRSGLVVAQFALSLVLLAGAGLLVRTFAALMGTPTGMRTELVVTLHLPFPLGSERYKTPDVAIARFHHPLLENVRALPGVDAAGLISKIPLQESGANGNFGIVGKSFDNVASQPFAEMRIVSPGYFATMGIPVVRGRDFAESDDAKSQPVVMINEDAAKKYFPNEDPVGRQLAFGTPGPQNPPAIIVGVVGSVRQASLETPPLSELYFPYRQAGGALSDMALMIRATKDPNSVVRSVQNAIRTLDPAQPVYNVKTMRDVMADSVAERRLYLRLLAAFAGVALLLAMAGIYGVIAYGVTQRTREFGIRIALGCESSRIKRMVVWQGTRLALFGLAIGIPGAFAMSALIASVLYGVGRADPLTYAAVASLLVAVSLVATYMPARRAVRVDPLVAMRSE